MKEKIVSFGSASGGVAAALISAAASICCIGPLGIAILGVNGAILAAGIKPWRPYLLAGSLVLIVIGFAVVYGRRDVRSGAACPTRAGRFTRVALWGAAVVWVASLVVGFLADRYWL